MINHQEDAIICDLVDLIIIYIYVYIIIFIFQGDQDLTTNKLISINGGEMQIIFKQLYNNCNRSKQSIYVVTSLEPIITKV